MRRLLAFRHSFDAAFQAYLRKKIASYTLLAKDSGMRDMVGYIEQLAMKGGKRIRPYLADLGYTAARGHRLSGNGVHLFIALELFHVFALIHDDIMDQGWSRHGIPTAHIQVTALLRKKKRIGDISRSGESQAILLGDLVFAWANELIARSYAGISAKALGHMRTLFFQMIDDVVIGQMLDVDLMTRPTATLPTIIRKMYLKTASYTFIKPLQIGATFGGGSRELCASLGKMGESLGLAFQIQDDLMDILAPSAEIKKTVFSDIADRQHTLCTLHIMQRGTTAQKRELAGLFGVRLTEADRPRVMELFSRSGAIRYAQRRMNGYFSRAEAAVDGLRISRDVKDALSEFVAHIRHRSA